MKKMFVIVLALLVIAMFVVSGCAPGSFTGEARKMPSAKKPTAVEKPFDVMKSRFTSLGVSEDEMWKKLRSSNVILYDFKGDMQLAFALRQINDPKVDAKTKQASKEWVKEKINKQYASFTADDLKNTAWLITAENDLKAVSLKLSAYSSDLPLDPEGLKAYLDKTGEGGAAGSAAGAGGSGGAAASGGKSASTVKMGASSMLDCVQGGAAKSLTGDGNRPKTPEKKTAGGKPSVTDGSGDSTTTEGQNKDKTNMGGSGGPCSAVNWDAAKGGNGGISDEGDKPVGDGSGETVNKDQKELDKNSFDVTGTTPDGTDVQSSFEAKEVYKVNGKVTIVNGKLDGKDVSLTPAGINKAFKDGQDWFKDNKVTTSSTFKGSNVKSGQKQANPLEGSDGAATNNCAGAVSACASTPGQFFGANAQLKKLAQDCLNEAEGGSIQSEGSTGWSPSQTPAPSACDKVSPGCMKQLSVGPLIDYEGGQSSTSCYALSGDALGFSKQMMVTDPVDLVGKLGMVSQIAQAAQKASTGSASTTATGTASATTGTASTGANDQKAAAGSGECGGEACA